MLGLSQTMLVKGATVFYVELITYPFPIPDAGLAQLCW